MGGSPLAGLAKSSGRGFPAGRPLAGQKSARKSRFWVKIYPEKKVAT